MNSILVCTSNRSEYTVLEPILSALDSREDIRLTIYITGSHLDSNRGRSVDEIISQFNNVVIDNITFDERSIQYQCQVVSKIVQNLGSYLEKNKQDAVLLLGDRLETLAFATAANLLNTRIIHFSGGDTSLGSNDDLYRKLISLNSSFHLPKIDAHAEKLRSLGIESDSIFVTGYLAGLTIKERLNNGSPLPKKIQNIVDSGAEFLLINFHARKNSDGSDIIPLKEALSHYKQKFKLVFTAANADPGGFRINEHIKSFCKNSSDSIYIPQLGRNSFLKVANLSKALVGNSSAGILETKFINKPALNILPRQLGRETNKNVLTVNNTVSDIRVGLENITSEEFLKETLNDKINIYHPKKINEIMDQILDYVQR